MKKLVLIICLLIAILAIAITISSNYNISKSLSHEDSQNKEGVGSMAIGSSNYQSGNSGNNPNNEMTDENKYQNLINYLASNGFIQDTPESGIVTIGFYHLEGGSKKYEKYYTINKGMIETRNAENPEIFIWFHSKYIDDLKSKDFCQVAKKARDNRELGANINMSTWAKLKYSSLYSKYKDCI